MSRHTLILCLLLAAISACASVKATWQETASADEQRFHRDLILQELKNDPRTVSIWIDEEVTYLEVNRFLVREYHGGKDAARGAAEASVEWLAESLGSGDVIMMIVGIATTPIAAVVGAFAGAAQSDPPVIQHTELPNNEAAKVLAKAAAKHGRFSTLLKDNFVRRSTLGEHHRIGFVSLGKPEDHERSEAAEIVLKVSIRTLGLLGEPDDDPITALVAYGKTTIEAEWATETGSYICGWTYRGSNRRLSEWAENDAERFVAEIRLAAKSVADMISKVLDADPTNCPAPQEFSQSYDYTTSPVPQPSTPENRPPSVKEGFAACLSTTMDCSLPPEAAQKSTHIALRKTSLLNFPANGSLVLRQIEGCEKLELIETKDASEWAKVRRIEREGPIGFVRKDALARIENFSAVLSVTADGYRLPGGSLVTQVHKGTIVQIALSVDHDGEVWYATDSLGQRIWILRKHCYLGVD
jgi:hypothetical protein